MIALQSFFSVSIFILLQYSSAYNASSKIKFGFENITGWHITHQTTKSDLFDIIVIDGTHECKKLEGIEIFSWYDYKTLSRTLSYQASTYDFVVPKTHIENSERVMDLFNNKTEWIQFMSNIGLQDYVPRVYHTNECDGFPCVVKTNAHWGTGVKVAMNSSHLQSIVNDLQSKNMNEGVRYHIEEALTGMGLDEGAAYGSVYKGEIQSMHCTVRSHNPNDVKNQGHGESGIFVRGFQLTKAETKETACGSDVLSSMEHMFRKVPFSPLYTGAFCVSIKANSTGHIKFLEVNARMCQPHDASDKVFLSTYVPLAFAIKHGLAFGGTAGGGWHDKKEYKKIQKILDVEKVKLQESRNGGKFDWRTTRKKHIV